MAVYTAPTTRADGYVVPASEWNTNVVENVKYFKDAPNFDGLATFDLGIALVSGQKVFLDGIAGTGDTYIYESAANVLDLFAGGANTLRLSATAATVTGTLTASGNVGIAATNKILLDGVSLAGDTYITESAANTIRIFAGGTRIVQLDTVTGVQFFSTGPIIDGTGFSMTTWPTTVSVANAFVADGGHVRLVTSLRAAKHSIVDVTGEDAKHTVLALRPVLYRSAVDTDQREWAGFIAEDTEQVNPVLAMYDGDQRLQGVAYDRVPAYLVRLAQDHDARIAALEAARG